jgi:TonB family protein
MERSMIKASCIAVVCVLVLGVAAGAQIGNPASRLDAASALTSLDGIAQPAWHLKLDVTVFGDKGKNPSEGTIEVWHSGADERTVSVFGGASGTTMKHDGKSYYKLSGPSLPFEAEEVLQQVVHPGPRPSEAIDAVPEIQKHKFGKVELDCVMLTQPIKGAGKVPLGLFPTYCMDAAGIIRYTYNFGGQSVILNSMGKFLDHDVATAAVIRGDEFEVASAKVVTLTTYTPQPDEFVPGVDMVQVGATVRASGGVMAGNIVSKVQPFYPEGAKERHESGTVILHAIIGRDGHVHSLRPVNASDPDFVIAAIAAVRQWTYKPYLLNGEPTEVDTTITVNFALNGG